MKIEIDRQDCRRLRSMLECLEAELLDSLAFADDGDYRDALTTQYNWAASMKVKLDTARAND